jgi:hypothetical protein
MKTKGDDIVYRFTFDQENQDPTTFFNIRLGKQNLKTTYRLERSLDGGSSFQTIVQKGIVPPPNIGPRSISSQVGLGAADYKTLMKQAVTMRLRVKKFFVEQQTIHSLSTWWNFRFRRCAKNNWHKVDRWIELPECFNHRFAD